MRPALAVAPPPEPRSPALWRMLSRLHRRTFAGRERGWSAGEIAALAAGDGVALWCLRRGAAPPLGFALVRAAGGEAEILTLAVARGARRRGFAAALLDAAEQGAARAGARAMLLEVGEEARPARALYAARGYRLVGRRRGYYAGPPREDALVLRLVLAEPDQP